MLDQLRKLILDEDNEGLFELLNNGVVKPMDLVKAGALLAYEDEDNDDVSREFVPEGDEQFIDNESENQTQLPNAGMPFLNFTEFLNQSLQSIQSMFPHQEGGNGEQSKMDLNSMFSSFANIFNPNNMADQSSGCSNPNCPCDPCECDPGDCDQGDCDQQNDENKCENPDCTCDPCECDPCDCDQGDCDQGDYDPCECDQNEELDVDEE